MESKIDIVSRTTGRVLLSSLFETPTEGLTTNELRRVITVLRYTRLKLQDTFPKTFVRLALDSYEASVFWYLVLFRPLIYDPRNPLLGDKTWSIFEMIQAGVGNRLQRTDLGVVYDNERDWLALVWPEARRRHGILQGLEECPSWKRLNKDHKISMQHAAESFSFTVGYEHLKRLGYLQRHLWHRGLLEYEDISVLDLRGIHVSTLVLEDGEEKKVELPVAIRARYVHFFTKDKREFKAALKIMKQEEVAEAQRQRRKEKKEKVRRFRIRPEEKEPWFQASRVIAQIYRHLGGPRKRGRLPDYLSGEKAHEWHQLMWNLYINGDLRPNWPRVGKAVAELRVLLDPTVPEEFADWLQWNSELEKEAEHGRVKPK